MVQLKCLKISFLRSCVQRFVFENPTIDHQYCQAEVPRLTKKQSIDYLEKYSVGIDRYDFMTPLSFVDPKVCSIVEPAVESLVVEPLVVEHVLVEPLVVEPLLVEHVTVESVTDEPMVLKPPK